VEPELSSGWQQDIQGNNIVGLHIAGQLKESSSYVEVTECEGDACEKEKTESKVKRGRTRAAVAAELRDVSALRQLCAEASDMLHEMLPGGPSRDAFSAQAMQVARRERNRLLAVYLKNPTSATMHCTETAFVDLLVRPSTFVPRRVHIEPAARERLIHMYAATITEWYCHLRLFDATGEWPPAHLRFGSFFLSVLYMTKRGLEHNESVLVPQDEFLASQLPPPNTLLSYEAAGIQKCYNSRFTNTSKAIRAYVIYLHERGVSLSALCMQPFDSSAALANLHWDPLEALLRRRACMPCSHSKRPRLAIEHSADDV
jgi:hypothetical protein